MPSSNSPVYIMAIISKLKNSGITFSDSELELLIECFTENMTINEKNRFDSILKMLKR